MELIIGGYAQGKLEYVLRDKGMEMALVFDQKLPEHAIQDAVLIIDHLHLWIRQRLLDHAEPETEIMAFVDRNPNCILISDEIGNGIVPMDPFEREYRERTGRILICLAKRAEKVERVFCGIGQRIK